MQFFCFGSVLLFDVSYTKRFAAIEYDREQVSSPSLKYYFLAHCCILILSCNRTVKKGVLTSLSSLYFYM